MKAGSKNESAISFGESKLPAFLSISIFNPLSKHLVYQLFETIIPEQNIFPAKPNRCNIGKDALTPLSIIFPQVLSCVQKQEWSALL